MAEQLLKFAASARWDLGDDTSLMNLYLPQKSYQGQKEPISAKDIQTLLFGIHTAASVEVMSFARALKADWASLTSVVKDAAGANKAFELLLKDSGTGQAPEKFASEKPYHRRGRDGESHSADDDRPGLLISLKSSIIDKISGYGPPLPLTSVAIQALCFGR